MNYSFAFIVMSGTLALHLGMVWKVMIEMHASLHLLLLLLLLLLLAASHRWFRSTQTWTSGRLKKASDEGVAAATL